MNLYGSIMLLIMALVLSGARAAPPASDFDILEASAKIDNGYHEPHVSLIEGRPGQTVAGYNPLSVAFSGLMYTYQRWVSPQLPSECLYEHSCSGFSKMLISEFGLAKGVVSTADRLMRCNRVAATDIHPLFVNDKSGLIKESVDIYKMKSE